MEIRKAVASDGAGLADLVGRTVMHYSKNSSYDADHAAGTADALLNGRSNSHTLLALIDGKPAGYATYAVMHPSASAGGMIYMKDLFVSAEARGEGVGEALMRAVAAAAVEKGCSRFEWTTDHSNPKAKAFYERLGASRIEDKVYYRVEGDALGRMAKNHHG
ncbi:MAG: GNAT family N-acetyltransferase [Alphaproteobacteria bacterium]|nr:GNAT family N-acetyltransferase [Alphaproteobacteria bacterium]